MILLLLQVYDKWLLILLKYNYKSSLIKIVYYDVLKVQENFELFDNINM